MDLADLAARVRALYSPQRIAACLAVPPPADLARYRNDPNGFIRDILGVNLTPDQIAIADRFVRRPNSPPRRIKVNAGHNVGKTLEAACLALWWFYSRPAAVIITTAPTEKDVIDLLWTEMRLRHRNAKVPLPDWFYPAKPYMWENEEHWAQGYTARKKESFHGRHRESMFFIFDEAEGVDPPYWESTNTMFQPDMDHAWLAIGNPTTTSSQSYLEDLSTAPDGGAKWQTFTLSALNHPNVLDQLAGCKPRIPNAVTLGQVEQWFQDWTDRVATGDALPTDVEWPPGSGVYYRPGPSFLSRVMGKRPTAGVDTVWSEDLWLRATNPAIPSRERMQIAWGQRAGPTIGLDPALFGDDDTSFHVRIGPVSVHHESHNGWAQDKSAKRLKELCEEWATKYDELAFQERARWDPLDVAVTIEGDGGYGAGVHSHRGKFRRWKLVSAGSASDIFMNGKPQYFNMRSQWWCESARIADAGGVDLSMLPRDVLARLRFQLLAPCYWMVGAAKKVEPKDDLKDRLKRSPDDADAFILSHYNVKTYLPTVITAGAGEEV